MRLKREVTFKLTVKVLMPTEKLDVSREETFTATYKLLTSDEIAELSAGKYTVAEQLDRVLLKVENVGNEEGEAYPEDEALALIKQNTITAMAALHAFNKAANKDIVGKTAKT